MGCSWAGVAGPVLTPLWGSARSKGSGGIWETLVTGEDGPEALRRWGRAGGPGRSQSHNRQARLGFQELGLPGTFGPGGSCCLWGVAGAESRVLGGRLGWRGSTGLCGDWTDVQA